MNADLTDKMINYANERSFPKDHPFRVAALKFTEAVKEGNLKRILGTWAKARRMWCEETGEPLI